MATSEPKAQPKALFFDVFGTCVDWHPTVTDALYTTAQKLGETKLNRADWALLAQNWRTSYLQYTRSIAASPNSTSPPKTVDAHHLSSLHTLLHEAGLSHHFPSHILEDLSLIWHRLPPWPDTAEGLQMLNYSGYDTATLTNGNVALIRDLAAFGELPFRHLLSAEDFGTFKPNEKVYRGAAEKLELRAEECGMVAAHLGDLKAAKACGFTTYYVERPGEEREPEMEGKEGFVDVWVKEGEEGFVGLAQRLQQQGSE